MALGWTAKRRKGGEEDIVLVDHAVVEALQGLVTTHDAPWPYAAEVIATSTLTRYRPPFES